MSTTEIVSLFDLNVGDVVRAHGVTFRIVAENCRYIGEYGEVVNWKTEYLSGSSGWDDIDWNMKEGRWTIQGNAHKKITRLSGSLVGRGL